VRALLSDPNTLSPANSEASKIYYENKVEYEQKVREVVELSLEEEKDYDKIAVEEDRAEEEEERREKEKR
jgi:hypothetical protein